MEKGLLVWIKNPTLENALKDQLWFPGVITQSTHLVDIGKSQIEVTSYDIGTKEYLIPFGAQETDELKPRNTLLDADEENLQNLSCLNEPEMLIHLKSRYEKNLIFTYSGPILLSINPFDEIVPSQKCGRMIQRFIDQVRYEATSFSGVASSVKHSIIVSGESGSGKSEVSKLILNSLGGRRAADQAHLTWFGNILLANKILESFGAARTVKTGNSSRFGKLIELKLNAAGDLISGAFKTYLLESSRTSSQQVGERNFNVFYQLIAGASSDEAKRWHLLPTDLFHFVNQGAICHPKGKRDDALKFKDLRDGLSKIGLLPELASGLFDLLAGVLALGQIVFVSLDDSSGGCRVVDSDVEDGPLQNAAQLLGVTPVQLEDLLISKIMTTKGEAIKRKLPIAQAIIARDAVAKALYKTIFDWIVAFLNERLSSTFPKGSDQSDHLTITVVDIFGMDALNHNSLDQLCINYANEALHQFFNYHMFKLEVELYKSEGISYQQFDFPDNQENLVLIGNGIFKILDDQCKLPNPTDKRLAAQFYKEYSNHPLFTVTTFQQQENKFTIVHFAGPVEYTVDDFILKNLDNLPSDTGAVVGSSRNIFLATVLQTSQGSSRRRGSLAAAAGGSALGSANRTNAPSFVAQVKTDLTLLLKEIESTEPHYVMCFKPHEREVDSAEEIRNRTLSMVFSAANVAAALNSPVAFPTANKTSIGAKKEVKFDQVKVAEQLKYSGILDAVRIGRIGFRTRLPYVEFYNRYRILANKLIDVQFDGPTSISASASPDEARRLCQGLITSLSSSSDQIEDHNLHEKIVRSATMIRIVAEAKANALPGVIDGKNVQFGNALIFMLKKEHDVLETLRNSNLRVYVIRIQKIYRSFYAMIVFRRRMRMRLRAVLTLQRNFRALRFYYRIVALQCLVRRFVARRKVVVIRERREKLLALYGPLIVSREMRLKRRKDFQDSAKESIHGILVPEIRLSECRIREDELLREIMELVAESKVGETGEFDFYKLIDILSARIKALRNNDYKIAMIQFIRSLIPAEHLLRTWELTNSTVIGNLVGPLVWKLFYKGDIPEVHLNSRHQIFLPVDRMISKINTVAELTDKESQAMEMERSSMRQFGVSGNTSSVRRMNSDAMINKLNAQIHNLTKIQNLLRFFHKYFSIFISNFCIDYGEASRYHKGFSREKDYVKDLLQKIEKMKVEKPVRTEKDRDTLYSVSKCRLKVEWKDTVESMKQISPEAIVQRKSKFSRDDKNDILRKIADLDKARKEFSYDILRIVDHNNVGYQYMPHSPGISFAINSFFNLLCERSLPPRRLIKLMGTRQIEGKVAYYQAAPFMTNSSFMDILYDPILIEQLDPKTFSAAVLTSLLLNLTNLQPNHVLINLTKQPKSVRASIAKNTALNVYGFNSDTTLQTCFLDFMNPMRNKLHGNNMNVLYFMPMMDEPVDPDVKSFLSSSPFICEEIVMSWLRDLYEQNSRFNQLKNAGFAPSDFKSLKLPIYLSKGSIMQVYKRLKMIVEMVVASSATSSQKASLKAAVTLQDILSLSYPDMGNYYEDKRNNSDFTEGVDFSGVVSYAFVYHQSLESEKSRVISRKENRLTNVNINQVAAGISDMGGVDVSEVSVSLNTGAEDHRQASTSSTGRDNLDSEQDSAGFDGEPIKMAHDESERPSEENSQGSIGSPKPVLVSHPSVHLSYKNIYDDPNQGLNYESPFTPFKKIQTNMVLRSSLKISRTKSREIGYDNIFDGTDNFVGANDSMRFVSAPAEFKKITTSKQTTKNDTKGVDGSKLNARFNPLNETIEDEALDFLTNLDFRDFAEIKPQGRAVEFCELIGKNMSFLPSLWLNHIAEWQLRAVFSFWLKLQALDSLDSTRLKLKTTEIILKYNNKVEMEQMKESRLIVKLQKKLKMSVKFAILNTFKDENGDAIISEQSSKIITINLHKDKEADIVNDSAGQPPNSTLFTNDDQYDIYTFEPSFEDDENEEGESDDEGMALSAPERESKKRLMHILWSCENLMQESDISKLEADIKVIKKVIAQVVVPVAHDVESKLIIDFSELLLKYPGLAPIGVVIAERHGFSMNKQIIHKLIAHDLVERYVDVILALLECHPDLLLLIDADTSLLPCDRIKKMSESKACKYPLLFRFVNFAAEPAQKHFQSLEINNIYNVYDILSRSKGIFSTYRGEEELIIRAAHYGLLATEMELKLRRYDMSKRCEAKNEPLLLKLLVDDINGDESRKSEAYITFTLLIRALDERVISGSMIPQEMEDMLFRDIDMNNLTPADLIEYGMNQTNLEKSIIFQELNKQSSISHKRTHSRLSMSSRKGGSRYSGSFFGFSASRSNANILG